MKDNIDAFENLPGRAHPRAEHSRVGRGLMVGMMRGVLDRLGIDHTAEEQEADGQARCDESLEWSVHSHWSGY